ncbi:hypothetical protein [Aliarcobacter cryaerophilus]|nr:hypothetical protein [Aliarcobacter cryaerophilus]MCT7491877.1 hypothetical protein [Aliarcobacter cryaerophilus]MCT7498324.1 hypothetical protein [Aliarcobacter cryaerophilus]MCT7532378.1 hypothetical protein [Aliarcobacter cryaerophilus]MCT7542693.1 hypothetical protein [Aliarcobacter cryaerophilus]
MSNGVGGWKAFILKIFMKLGWLIIKTIEGIANLITAIFSKK